MLDGSSILWWDIIGALQIAGYEVSTERVMAIREISDRENCKYLGGRIYGIIDEIAKNEHWRKKTKPIRR